MKKRVRVLFMAVSAVIALSPVMACYASWTEGAQSPEMVGARRSAQNGNGIYALMLEAGVITQSTYDAIEAYFGDRSPEAEPDMENPPAMNRPDMTAALEKLVAVGTISQTAYDAIMDYMESVMPSQPDVMSQTGYMPERTDMPGQPGGRGQMGGPGQTDMPEPPSGQNQMSMPDRAGGQDQPDMQGQPGGRG